MFKPEDFERFLYHPENKEALAKYCNHRIAQSAIVYGRFDGKKIHWGSNDTEHSVDNRKAYLVGIEEIKK